MPATPSRLALCGAALALAFAPLAGQAATNFTVLHDFSTAEGHGAGAGLIADGAGNLYGTTQFGGGVGIAGDGVVFQLRKAGESVAVLHTFTGATDGASPAAALAMDGAGALYGTTSSGGPGGGAGTVFRLLPPAGDFRIWRFQLLHTFHGPDGATPLSRLVIDAKGTLYGTTRDGGAGYGTVFALTPPPEGKSGWGYHQLYRFTGGADGAHPKAGLTADASGHLYGTASAGGAMGDGAIYELLPAVMPEPWTESVLHSFAGGPYDGSAPDSELAMDAAGRLYGTTPAGGANGVGSLYELLPAVMPAGPWTELLLHSFGGAGDGAIPSQGVVPGPNGALYGVTAAGGSMRYGTIYELLPAVRGAATERVLHSFNGATEGGAPSHAALLAIGNALVGTTFEGGTSDNGTVFELME